MVLERERERERKRERERERERELERDQDERTTTWGGGDERQWRWRWSWLRVGLRERLGKDRERKSDEGSSRRQPSLLVSGSRWREKLEKLAMVDQLYFQERNGWKSFSTLYLYDFKGSNRVHEGIE